MKIVLYKILKIKNDSINNQMKMMIIRDKFFQSQ